MQSWKVMGAESVQRLCWPQAQTTDSQGTQVVPLTSTVLKGHAMAHSAGPTVFQIFWLLTGSSSSRGQSWHSGGARRSSGSIQREV